MKKVVYLVWRSCKNDDGMEHDSVMGITEKRSIAEKYIEKAKLELKASIKKNISEKYSFVDRNDGSIEMYLEGWPDKIAAYRWEIQEFELIES